MKKCIGVHKIAAAAVTLGIMVVVTACGSGRDYDSPTGGPIEIERSQLNISVSNRSGAGLNDVKLEVFPVGRQMVFSATIYRLESEATNRFSLGELRGSDGTPFNQRVHRPESIRVTARGTGGDDAYEIEVAWE